MFTQHHQDALELELSVLQSVLTRNQYSHRRAKYYQHLHMTIRYIIKSGFLRIYATALDIITKLEKLDALQKSRRVRQTVFWSTSNQAMLRTGDDDALLDACERQFQEIFACVCGSGTFDSDGTTDETAAASSYSCAILSTFLARTERTAQFLWKEIARGFFLPFCTVAVAALARIRMLILQLANHVLDVVLPRIRGLLQQIHDTYHNKSGNTTLTEEDSRQKYAPQRQRELEQATRLLLTGQTMVVNTVPIPQQQPLREKGNYPFDRMLEELSVPRRRPNRITHPSRRKNNPLECSPTRRDHDTLINQETEDDDDSISPMALFNSEESMSHQLQAHPLHLNAMVDDRTTEHADDDLGDCVFVAVKTASALTQNFTPFNDSTSDTAVDKNLLLVEHLRNTATQKQQQQHQKNRLLKRKVGSDLKKKKKKRETVDDEPFNGRFEAKQPQSQQKKLKKNSKNKDKDFFDDLFG